MQTSLQEIILGLQNFWAKEGCVILMPYDMEMGAGTFHPATTLKALGKKPFACAFVQPSRRPQDGRYGENPNRVQKFLQFQVLIKPVSEDPQNQLLRSFEFIGLDPVQNDIRFVEDDWESPSLGASGLGWEVWCNGMEVVQFTYFQKMGGMSCEKISVEITYGLERLALCLQEKESFFEMMWNDKGHVHSMTYGDLMLQEEKEMSAFYFEKACPQDVFESFHKALETGHVLVKENLVIPAYEHCIKSSHLFNVLDASGAIGTSQRAQFIQKIRTLAGACCQKWLEGNG